MIRPFGAFGQTICVLPGRIRPRDTAAKTKGNSMRAETMLAELNRLRKDLDEDPTDIEWLTLHHAFCFISYKMGDFQAYLDEETKKGSFEEFED